MCNNLVVSLVMSPWWGRECPPLSISLLGGNLRNKGYKTHLFDLNNYFYHKVPSQYKDFWDQEKFSLWTNKESVENLLLEIDKEISSAIDAIVATKSHVVGFSGLLSTIVFSLNIAQKIKRRSSDCKIVFGGPAINKDSAPEFLAEYDFVDALIFKEGDETLPEALRDIAETGKFKKIPGLMFKENGEIIDGGLRTPLKNLDDIPFADYSDYDLSTYANPLRLDTFSSRSCVNKCHYCDESLYFERYRFRSGKNIFNEIVYHLEHHPQVKEFNFSDSMLNGSIKSIREFCDNIISHNIKISWGGQAIVRKEMTPELLRLMRSAGCVFLGYGVESGSDSVLKSMNKKLSSAALASQVLHDTHEAGIRAYANFMFGYPTETEKDFLETLKFIKDNAEWIDGVSPAQAFMVLLKDTYLQKNLLKFNINPHAHSIYWKTQDGLNTYPVRFKRYELFCRLCHELELDGIGVLNERTDKYISLGAYYEHENDFEMAYECYFTDLLKHGYNKSSLTHFMSCCEQLNRTEEGQSLLDIFNFGNPQSGNNSENYFENIPLRSNDQNWLKGIAREWATALLATNSVQMRNELTVGRYIEFVDGTVRLITAVQENGNALIVFLNGNPLNGKIIGFPNKFNVRNLNYFGTDSDTSELGAYSFVPCTDQNWLNGVAKDWANAFFTPASENAIRALLPGRMVVFCDGEKRQIVSTSIDDKHLIVFVTGHPLDGGTIGYPRVFKVMN